MKKEFKKTTERPDESSPVELNVRHGIVEWTDATKELPLDRSNIDEKISEMVLVTYKNDNMINAMSVSVAWYSYVESTWYHVEKPLYWAYYPAPCELARKALGTKVPDHKYA